MKKRVLELQGADAYNEYLGAYGKYIYNIKFRSGNNPDERKKLEKKRGKEFIINHSYVSILSVTGINLEVS